MSAYKIDLAITIIVFALGWAISAVVFPRVRIIFAFVAVLCVFVHLVMLGLIRNDDIEHNYSARQYIQDHTYSLGASGLVFLFVAGIFGLSGLAYS